MKTTINVPASLEVMHSGFEKLISELVAQLIVTIFENVKGIDTFKVEVSFDRNTLSIKSSFTDEFGSMVLDPIYFEVEKVHGQYGVRRFKYSCSKYPRVRGTSSGFEGLIATTIVLLRRHLQTRTKKAVV